MIHQHDPTIPHVGGIQTFIDTFIRNAPEDLEIDLLGVTVYPNRYPVGKWNVLSIGKKKFRFFPLVAANPVNVPRIPLSLKILWSLYRYRKMLSLQDAILEFHRIEPLLGFLRDKNHKILFLHGHNRKDFYNEKTEVRWGKFPQFYFWLEEKLLPQTSHIYLVREDAAIDYQEQYPSKKNEISFLPTWVDETVFQSLPEGERNTLRELLLSEQGLSSKSKVLLFAGRYEGQKDPFRLLEAFRYVNVRDSRACLILIGAGSLKVQMQKYVNENGLSSAIRFLPPMTQKGICEWMNAADALCLSSAFEGMPRVVVEALYCGLPVVGTAVGEIGRLIGDSQGGRIVVEAGSEPFAEAILDLINDSPSAELCRSQVESYTGHTILAPVYQYYRSLAEAKQ